MENQINSYLLTDKSEMVSLVGPMVSLVGPSLCLCFIKKHAIGGRFSGLGCTFQGQKHACKDFEIP